MKRYITKMPAWAAAAALAAGALAVLSCGTAPEGTNEASSQYFPIAVGDKWSYDTYNLTRDPNRANGFYTQVSIESVAPVNGGILKPTYVTKYAKAANDENLRLNQAGYWVNKDIYFKRDYFDYGEGNNYFYLHGYQYLNEYREPVIGGYFEDKDGDRIPMVLFKTPFQVGAKWDVFDRGNPDPEGSPTVLRDVHQKTYFGLLNDMDHDGREDFMDISIVGTIDGRELVELGSGKQINCYRVVLKQHLVFHLTHDGDVTDDSITTYWVAENYGFIKTRWHENSNYLDTVEMVLREWWFIE